MTNPAPATDQAAAPRPRVPPPQSPTAQPPQPPQPNQPPQPPQPPQPNWTVLAPVPLGPPPPTLVQRRWPERSPTAEVPVLCAVVVTGLVAAASVPLDRTGLGWLVTAVAVFGALAFAAARGASRIRPAAVGWGVAAVALLSVGFVRASEWLFALCVLAAFGCVALALTAGRTPIGVLLAVLAVPLAALRGLPWASRGLERIRRASGAAAALRLAASAAVGLLLILVFGALFASADPAFEKMADAAIPDVSGEIIFRWAFLFTFVGLGTLGGAYLLANPSTLGDVATATPRPLRRLEWALPVGGLLVLFGAFVGVQLTILFGDREYVMRTVGLTFAEYARRGFWQLLLITLLTLVVMAVALRKAPRADTADRVLLRVLLGALALCSLVVVGSALWRMSVYEQVYGFTRLRVLVSAFELWLGGLFVLVLIAGIRLRTSWLPRTAVAGWVLTLLALAVLNPDRFIAAQNVSRFEESGKIDVWYLSTLSADAVPELDRLPAEQRACALADIAEQLRDRPDDWRSLNLARERARTVVAGGEPVDSHCARRY